MSYAALYEESILHPETFWKKQSEEVPWFQTPTQILRTDVEGRYRWFPDGTLNTAYACLDHHVHQGRGEQVAVIYDSPVTKTIQRYTYRELTEKVSQFADGLRQLGIHHGDTVVIYMPVIPEALIAMLACARLGAIHSVVFGGFAPHELAMRIDDAQPKAIISASYGIEIDRVIPYKPLVDKAITEAQYKPPRCIYFQREVNYDVLNGTTELDFMEVMRSGKAVEPQPVKSTDPLYILYTSGTTGKPKGIVRDHGGHATALLFSMKHVYNAQPGDVFWAASDVGWAVGHSYMVYGPLLYGCTTIVYEGKPIKTPDAGAFWRVIQEHNVNIMFTAPTALRAIKKEDDAGEFLKKYPIPSLRHFFLAGERLDAATYHWVADLLKIPIIDHWWQTESGWPMLGIMMGVEQFPTRPGSAGKPVCGFDIQIFSEEGTVQPARKEGYVVIKLPLPPGCLPTLWRNEERFVKGYLEHFPGYYFTGDGGYTDDDGYFYITGRVDDVINVSGHRLSTGEMEELVSSHPSIAECAVVGIQDELRGQRPVALFVLKNGLQRTEAEVEKELVDLIREKIGAVAVFKQAILVQRLPKTRSGKILRKNIRHIADGTPFTMPSTIDDPAILDEIKHALETRQIGMAFEPRAEEEGKHHAA